MLIKLISLSFIISSKACILPGIQSVYFCIVYETVGFIKIPIPSLLLRRTRYFLSPVSMKCGCFLLNEFLAACRVYDCLTFPMRIFVLV